MDLSTEQLGTIFKGVRKLQDKGKNKKQDSILSSVYKKYPALMKMGDIALKADKKFSADKTGGGSIEYFSPEQDTITYGTGYKYGHPEKGKHGIVYNPKTNTKQDIALDMLHGMTVDENYAAKREEFSNAVMDSDFSGDLMNEWNEYNNETNEQNDGFDQFKNNWIDGMIRNLLFEGKSRDFKKSKYWEDAKKVYLSDDRIKDKFSKLETYLKTGKE